MRSVNPPDSQYCCVLRGFADRFLLGSPSLRLLPHEAKRRCGTGEPRASRLHARTTPQPPCLPGSGSRLRLGRNDAGRGWSSERGQRQRLPPHARQGRQWVPDLRPSASSGTTAEREGRPCAPPLLRCSARALGTGARFPPPLPSHRARASATRCPLAARAAARTHRPSSIHRLSSRPQ